MNVSALFMIRRPWRVAPLFAAAAILAVGGALGGAAALANTPVAYTTSGNATAKPRDGQITVDGRTYTIAPGSPAASQASDVLQGDSVKLTLNGPPDSPSTQVVAIHDVHSR